MVVFNLRVGCGSGGRAVIHSLEDGLILDRSQSILGKTLNPKLLPGIV